MKVFTYLLLLLLLAGLGGAAYFYINTYQPMTADYNLLKAGKPEQDRTKDELTKYRERNSWIKPAIETLKTALDTEEKAGTAEVVAADNGTVVLNISEKVLYTPGSVTFAKDSAEARTKIVSLLKSLKGLNDKEIAIGNTTDPAPPQGKGRRKIPGREARELASARSVALVKDLEKNGIAPASLVAVAYPSKQTDRGFNIKDHKTVIIIGYPMRPLHEAAAPAPKPAPTTKGAEPTTAPSPAQPRQIPIQPAPPKPQ